MTVKRWTAALCPFAILASALLLPAVAVAESRCSWRIIIGAPPDPDYQDFDENGKLLPRGFSPGYGYAEDYMKQPSIVLSSEHPCPQNVHAPAAFVMPPPEMISTEAGRMSKAARLRVRVPADAEVWFSGDPTTQRGTERWFVTPALAEGQTFSYEVRALWKQDGKEVSRSQRVTVSPGDRVTVDFLQPAPVKEEPQLIPPPRKLDRP